MKKVISLVVSIVMLVCMLPVGVMATTTTDANLIFEMDLSAYTDSTKTVTNSAPNADSTITVNGAPTLGTTAGGQKYLTFRRTTQATPVSGTSVKVVDSDIAAADALTIEAWVRAEGYNLAGSKSGRIFGLGNGTNHFADFMVGPVKNVYYKATGQVATNQTGSSYQTLVKGNMNVYDETWVHYVITREWVAGENGAGTWKIGFYVNGDEVETSAEYAVASRTDESDKFLMIGAHKGGTAALWGDIGTFKVYNRILTQDEAIANHEATEGLFYPIPQGEKLIIDMDLSDYDDTGKTVKNAAQYVDTTITVNGTPNLGTTEGGQKYLTFATEEKAAANNDGNRVYEAITFEEDYLKDQDAMTFEMWVRPTDLDYDARLFVMVNSSGIRVADLYVNSANKSFNYRPGSDETTGQITRTMTGQLGQWIHLAFTREWTPDASGTTGTWDGALFVNGNQVQTTSIPNYTRKSETGAYFVLGNLQAKTRAFFGDIATFKVYNSVLTEDSVKAKYESSVSGFVPAVTFSEFTTASTSVTATLADYVTEQLPSEYEVIMAVYDGDRLVDCSLGRTLNLEGLTLKTGMEIRCFIWDGLTNCTPLVEDCNTYCL